jgi:hypothetical protein
MTSTRANRRQHQPYLRALVAALAFASSSACAENDAVPTDMGAEAISCSSSWQGTLAYSGTRLTFRTCLKAGHCSAERELPSLSALAELPVECTKLGDLPVSCGEPSAEENPEFGMGAGWDPVAGEPGLVDVMVMLRYPLQVASTLGDRDRASLTIKAEDGSVLVESESQVPYRSFEGCKGVAPDLSGAPRW